MTANRTHRTRLARALAAVADIGYQDALRQVSTAAQAGELPARLDQAGMRGALDLLLARAGTTTPPGGGDATALQPRYHRLAEIVGGRYAPEVADRVEHARALGVAPVLLRGPYDPGDLLHPDDDEDDDNQDGANDTDLPPDWWVRITAAGSRDDFALVCPYPHGSDPDGYVPIDHALDDRDATGDVGAYEHALRRIAAAEPRDIDAWAHLGHLYLAMADGHGDLLVTPPPGARQRRAWWNTALGYYQSAVAIGELALPDPFHGYLVWAEYDFTHREVSCT